LIQTDLADVTHGQPVAINAALRRWGHLHDFIAFYDIDELLTLPKHNGLDDFVADFARLRGPFTALRSTSSWALLDLGAGVAMATTGGASGAASAGSTATALSGPSASAPGGPPNTNTGAPAAANAAVTSSTRNSTAPVRRLSSVTLADLATLRLVRGPPGGREKYFVNVSALAAVGAKSVNIHGVYSHQVAGEPGHAQVLAAADGLLGAFHVHLLNEENAERAADSREVYLPLAKRFVDADLAPFVRRAAVRARGERRRRKGGGGGGSGSRGSGGADSA
jgi:hypothetical protein